MIRMIRDYNNANVLYSLWRFFQSSAKHGPVKTHIKCLVSFAKANYTSRSWVHWMCLATVAATNIIHFPPQILAMYVYGIVVFIKNILYYLFYTLKLNLREKATFHLICTTIEGYGKQMLRFMGVCCKRINWCSPAL